ncbi:sensor histidine kinase [Paenibacillus apiarius]|uniref:sensor histidine kinase n=1 Tax=Paenibacillus apiarius TaxID=46240 RepID=UPI003B3A85EA
MSECKNAQGTLDTAAGSKAMKDWPVLQIQVSDNGKGMDEDTLCSFFTKQPKSNQRLANIGVHNVLERIRLHYGEPYGMQVMSRLGEGTTVTFCLPLIHHISPGGQEQT